MFLKVNQSIRKHNYFTLFNFQSPQLWQNLFVRFPEIDEWVLYFGPSVGVVLPAPMTTPTSMAAMVNPWAATLALIMVWDLAVLPRLNMTSPYVKAPAVAKQPGHKSKNKESKANLKDYKCAINGLLRTIRSSRPVGRPHNTHFHETKEDKATFHRYIHKLSG